MPAARANSTFGLTGPVNPPHRSWGMRREGREAVTGIGRRWRAGARPRRADARAQGSPALRGEAGPGKHAMPREHAGPGTPSRRPRRPGTCGDEAGFTLIEIIVAFTILLIVLVPVASLLSNSIGQAASARQRLTALSLAEQYLELLNNTPFGPSTVNRTPTIPALPKIATPTPILQKAGVVRSSVAYDVYAEFNWASAGGKTPDLCTSGLTPKVIDLQVTVRWSHATQRVTDTTVINYPPSGLEPYGFLAVQVNGDPAGGPPADASGSSWSSRVQTVPVKLQSLTATTGSTTRTVGPNSYGCAFEEVPPGNYNVALSNPASPTRPSWVANDNERTAVAHSPLTVSAGEVTTTTFQYDEGSLVTLHYPSTTATDGVLACPAVGSILCMVAGQAPATAAKPATTPVAELSVQTSSGWKVTRPGMARIAALACTGSRCLAVGYGLTHTTGAPYADSVSTSTSGTPAFSKDTMSTGAVHVTTFDSITCPKQGGANACYAVGTGASGPVLLSAAITGTGASWSLDTVTLPTGVTLTGVVSLTCPGNTTCFATASTSSGPAILSLTSSTSWVADTLPATPATTALGPVTCPAATTCYALGANAGGAEVLSTGTTKNTWVADVLAPGTTVTSLSAAACPSTSECYALGTVRNGTTTVGAIFSLTPTNTSWSVDAEPATARVVSLTCPTTSVCVVVASTPTAPVLLARTGATTWATATVTMATGATLDSVSSVGCSPTGHCDAVGTASTSGSSGGVILSLSGTTWTEDTVPSAKAPAFLSGVACGTSVCAAPGATETGALYLDGKVTSTSWTDGTPSGAAGLYVAGAPVAVSDPNLLTTSTLVMAVPATPAKDLVQVGPVFPFAAGYSVAAASCTAEVTAASAQVTSAPGATATATLPLGLLPVKVVTPAGVPVSGATVSASVTDPTCAPLAPLSGGSDPASYSLEATGPLGLSQTAVIYDTYKVTVNAPGGHTASVVVKVTPTATVVGGVGQPLPSPVVVTVT